MAKCVLCAAYLLSWSMVLELLRGRVLAEQARQTLVSWLRRSDVVSPFLTLCFEAVAVSPPSATQLSFAQLREAAAVAASTRRLPWTPLPLLQASAADAAATAGPALESLLSASLSVDVCAAHAAARSVRSSGLTPRLRHARGEAHSASVAGGTGARRSARSRRPEGDEEDEWEMAEEERSHVFFGALSTRLYARTLHLLPALARAWWTNCGRALGEWASDMWCRCCGGQLTACARRVAHRQRNDLADQSAAHRRRNSSRRTRATRGCGHRTKAGGSSLPAEADWLVAAANVCCAAALRARWRPS